MKTLSYGNGVTTTYDYSDKTLRLTELETQKQGVILQKFAYRYDNVGNVTGIDDTINSASQSFEYDDLNRLVSASGICSGPVNIGTDYSWDQCSFDANGNMLSSPGKTMEYDYENRLTKVTTPAGTVEFTYDYAGARIIKQANLDAYEYTKYISNLCETKYSSVTGSVDTKYVYANGIKAASRKNNTVYYHHGDHLGSSSVITDEDGNRVQLLEYFAFGMTKVNIGSIDEAYKFTGKEL